ncbi:serine/threonine-protein kinase [Streptomyces sp. NPDC127068]|uniref:serine/threonine-protein kinase n=1 Tax=Streptomyces sp. NPDC127068 TaxID=3347127 RepID=UPI00365FCB09
MQPGTVQPLDVDEPTAIGPYRLVGRLGSGGMGRVYLGRSAGGRTVAVKVVHPHFARDEEFRARFRREVTAAQRVGGDWTAPVLDADPTAAVPWVATGYVAGPSLARAVSGPDGPVPLPAHTVRILGAGLAEALVRVHGLRLVHRDVKPSNVLLALDGPRLIDFGIARATDGTTTLTSTGVSIGSPGYMAPEQILGGDVTGAADVFSLGAVLAFAASGASPFPGDSSASLLYRVVHEEPELSGVTGELREVVAACLAKHPGDRPDAAELVRRLAPEGTGPLVPAGWLPTALVAEVSRVAVGLLDLDAVPHREPLAPAACPTGPVPFASPSVGGPGTTLPGGGRVGPPPPYPPAAVTPASFSAAPADAPTGTVSPDRISVSAGAERTADVRGRGRRVSCTIALVVAGALAAVTVGSAFVFDLFGGGDSGDGAPGSSDAKRPAVPERYLGTWEGEGFALSGALPMGTFTVTVRQAAGGATIGTFRQVDPIDGVCENVLVLRSADAKRLVATGRPKESNPYQCTTGAHEVRLEPTAEGLRYESDNAPAGNPTAQLEKVS